MTHPFELSGHGHAPYRCVGMRENWFEMPGFGRKPGGSCQHCGTGILYEYQIVSSDGVRFHVGSSCVEKTEKTMDGYQAVRTAHVSAQRQACATKRRQEREEKWAAERSLRRVTARAEFEHEHGDLLARIESYTGPVEFVQSMKASLKEYGSLTEKMVTAVAGFFAREDEAAALQASSRPVGEIGQRCKSVPARVAMCIVVGQQDFYPFANKYLVKLVTVDGSVLIWWTSVRCQPSADVQTIAFTVKEHSVRDGVAQTIVQRVKFDSAK